MSLSLKDRVKQITNTQGTGSLTLVSTPTGFRSFDSCLSDGDTTYYCIESGSQWEVGIGTYSDNILARTTVLASSNSGSPINITANRSFVFISYVADKAVYRDGADRIVSGAAGIVFSDNSVQTTASVAPNWGAIGGTLSDQVDLSAALNLRALLPAVLPTVGTLLSYGGVGQLAAGGTVSHDGAIDATSFRRLGNTTQALQPADGIWYIDGSGGFRYRSTAAGYATRFSVSEAGAVTASGGVAIGNGSSSAPSLTFGSDPDTGFYRKSSNTIGVATAGAQSHEFQSDGSFQLMHPTGWLYSGFWAIRSSSSGTIDLRAGNGTTPATVTTGAITASGNSTVQLSSLLTVTANSNRVVLRHTSVPAVSYHCWDTNSYRVSSTMAIGFSATSDPNSDPDSMWCRGGPGIIQQRNGLNAQCFQIYNTYTSDTNAEWAVLDWKTTANTFRIGTEKGSGGGTARDLMIVTDGQNRMLFPAGGNVVIGAGSATGGKLEIVGNNTGGAFNNNLRFRDSDVSCDPDQCYGEIEWFSNDGSAPSAGVVGEYGMFAEASAPVGYHKWTTRVGGTLTEQMRLTSAGLLRVECGIRTTKSIYQTTEISSTPSGTTQTLTLNDGNYQSLSLASSTGNITLTLTVPSGSSSGDIIITQHGTTARDITWAVSSGSVRWLGTEPTWSSDATGSVRIVSWRWNGSIMFLTSSEAG